VSAGSITGAGGAINITGTGGNGTGGYNLGVEVTGALGVISNIGSGTITISGTGAGNTNSATDFGLEVASLRHGRRRRDGCQQHWRLCRGRGQHDQDDPGTVSFTSNGTAISGCTALPLTSSLTAVCMTSTLAVGTDAIMATYSGDTNYSGSSGSLSQLVNPTPSPLQFVAVTPCRLERFRGSCIR